MGRVHKGEIISSHIDCLMTKHKPADVCSRRCIYHHDFILTAHRTNAQHVPMTFSTQAEWTPWQPPQAPKGYTAQDRRTLVQEYKHKPQTWAIWPYGHSKWKARLQAQRTCTKPCKPCTGLLPTVWHTWNQPGDLPSQACIRIRRGAKVFPTCGAITEL